MAVYGGKRLRNTYKSLTKVLQKLIEDGLLRTEKRKDLSIQGQPEVDYYTNTLNGYIFEGYVQTAKAQAFEDNRLAAIERHQFRMTEDTLYVNKWVMRGTIGAAIATSLYLLWCIFSYGLDHHWWFASCCCCHRH